MEELMIRTVLLRPPPIDTHFFKVKENPFHYLWRNAMSQTKYVSNSEIVTPRPQIIRVDESLASPEIISDEDKSQSQSETSESSESTSTTGQSSIDESDHLDVDHTPKYSLREKRHLITREKILNFPAFFNEQNQFRPKRAKITDSRVPLQQQQQQQQQQPLKKQHLQQDPLKKQQQQQPLKKQHLQQDLLKKQQQRQQELLKTQQQHQQEILKKQQQINSQQKHMTKVTFHKPHDQVPKWTDKETMLLIIGVSKYGKNWTKIHTEYNLSANRSMQSMSMKYAALVRNGEHTKLLQAFKEKTIIKFVRPKGASSSTQTKSHKAVAKKISMSPPALPQELPIATPIHNLNFEDSSSFEQSPEFAPKRKSSQVQEAYRAAKNFYNDKQDPYFIQ